MKPLVVNTASGFFISSNTDQQLLNKNKYGGELMIRVMNVSISDDAVKEIDELARKRGRSRSNFVAMILKQALPQLRSNADEKSIKISI